MKTQNLIAILLISINSTGCWRTPLKAAETLAETALSTADHVIETSTSHPNEFIPTAEEMALAYRARIPLTVNIEHSSTLEISNLQVYLLNREIKKVIDKQALDPSLPILFKPNKSYYSGTYYGDTLVFKYDDHTQVSHKDIITLQGTDNFISVAFQDNAFKLQTSRYRQP